LLSSMDEVAAAMSNAMSILASLCAGGDYHGVATNKKRPGVNRGVLVCQFVSPIT